MIYIYQIHVYPVLDNGGRSDKALLILMNVRLSLPGPFHNRNGIGFHQPDSLYPL